MASVSILCDSAGIMAWEMAQLLLISSSPCSNPAPTTQIQEALLKLVVVPHINALLPWTKENATFIEHEEKVKAPQGRSDSQGRLLRRHSSVAQQSIHFPWKSEPGARNTAYGHHIKELLGNPRNHPATRGRTWSLSCQLSFIFIESLLTALLTSCNSVPLPGSLSLLSVPRAHLLKTSS